MEIKTSKHGFFVAKCDIPVYRVHRITHSWPRRFSNYEERSIFFPSTVQNLITHEKYEDADHRKFYSRNGHAGWHAFLEMHTALQIMSYTIMNDYRQGYNKDVEYFIRPLYIPVGSKCRIYETSFSFDQFNKEKDPREYNVKCSAIRTTRLLAL